MSSDVFYNEGMMFTIDETSPGCPTEYAIILNAFEVKSKSQKL